MKLNLKKRNRKRGISLVECVVALLLFAIATSMAFSVYNMAYGANDGVLEEYQTKIMANNVLSLFQTYEQMDEFMDAFEDVFNTPLAHDGSQDVTTTSTVYIPSDSTGEFEFNPSDALVSTPFSKIRAYESGKVDVLNSSGSAIVSFDYTGRLSQYSTDTAVLKDTNKYSASASYTSSYSTVGFEVTAQNNESFKVSGKTYKGDYILKYKVNETDASLSIVVSYNQGSNNDSKSYSVSWKTTALEKYYLRQGQFLFPNSSSLVNYDRQIPYIYFDVRKISDNTIATDSNGKLKSVRIKVTTDDWMDKTYWYNNKTGFTVNETCEGLRTSKQSLQEATYTKITKYQDITIPASYKFMGLPIYTRDANWRGTIPTYKDGKNNKKITAFSKESGGDFKNNYKNYILKVHMLCEPKSVTKEQKETKNLNYTDYTLKSGSSALAYALTTSSVVALYNPEKTLLYTYNGTTTAPINTIKKTFTDTETVDILGTSYTKYCKKVGAVSVDNVKFKDNGNNSEIQFCDGTKVIFTFMYNDYAKYCTDRDNIITHNGLYRTNYKFTLEYTKSTSNVDEIKLYTDLSSVTSSTSTTTRRFMAYYETAKFTTASNKYYYTIYNVTVNTKADKLLSSGSLLTYKYKLNYNGSGDPTITNSSTCTVAVQATRWSGAYSLKTGVTGVDTMPTSNFDDKLDVSKSYDQYSRSDFQHKYFGTTGFREDVTEYIGTHITSYYDGSSSQTYDLTNKIRNLSASELATGKIGNPTLTSDVLVLPDGDPVIRKETQDSPCQMVIKGSSDDATLLVSNATSVKYGDSPVSNDDFAEVKTEQDVTETVSSVTRYFKYMPTNSEYGLFIKVTYSTIAYDASVEPRIYIWYLTRDELASATPSSVYASDAYISYRKG